jgi:cellulose synthase/poly-beta-1,6-N-acetylglucosamine synthase-like glycosyltransferase
MENFLLETTIILAALTASKYTLYLLTSVFYGINKRNILKNVKGIAKSDIEDRIKISVIIPAWNEAVGILSCIRSLLKSEYKNLEIVVVNDGSTDNTEEVMHYFLKSKFPKIKTTKTIKYISKENGGKGSALNSGIKASSGNLVVTMDADTIFEPDALFEVAKCFYDGKLDAAVGNVKIANSKSLLGIIQQIEYTVGFYFKRTHSIFNSEYIIGGAFGAFRKSIFEKYGYFDTVIKTEDIEYSTRLQANGCKIFYIEDAIAHTEGPNTLEGLMKQRLRWKKGRLDTFLKHKNLFFSTSKKHNKFLTYYLLPITLFYEIELLFEPLFTTFGLYYMWTTGSLKPIVLWIAFTGFIYIYTFLFGSKKNSIKALTFTPMYFFLSYILTFVEVYAMYASIKLLLSKQDVVWQKWQRKGLENV